MLAESSTEGTKAIANQYELVRATSDEERKRTSEALNSIYEQATGETSHAVPPDERALPRDRAADEGDERRDAARDGETRTELRKGILELPQETAESAANMRRVIVEQIDALAELNRIVARHSRDSVERGAPRRAGRGERRRTRASTPGALRGAASGRPRGAGGAA